LENLVFYRDETHYFVMTAKKESLLEKGVLKENFEKNVDLLGHGNVDPDMLQKYVREVGTHCGLPEHCKLAKNHLDVEDVGIFDFSRKLKCLKPAKLLDPLPGMSQSCVVIMVGDALVEPFWPLGTGANRAVLSAMDASWLVKRFMEKENADIILHDAQVCCEALQQCTPDDLKPSFKQYTIDPQTRYKFCNVGGAYH